MLWPPATTRPGGPDHVGAAVEDPGEEVEGQPLPGPGDEVDGQQRLAAHGVHVGEGVGGRDPSPVVGVVDDGGEEVGADDQGLLVAEPVDGRVVGGVQAHQQVGVEGGIEAADEAEDRAQLGGGELGGAAAAGGVAGEAQGRGSSGSLGIGSSMCRRS